MLSNIRYSSQNYSSINLNFSISTLFLQSLYYIILTLDWYIKSGCSKGCAILSIFDIDTGMWQGHNP